jgi:peroxiredoxin
VNTRVCDIEAGSLFSSIFQLSAALSWISAAVPATYGLLEEAWEASILPLYDARSFSELRHYTQQLARPHRCKSLQPSFQDKAPPFQYSPVNVGFFLLRYNLLMGILRRLSRWMGSRDQMTHIVAGNIAPGFSLKALDQKEYSLRRLLEHGPVVAAFFKISCPVCQFTFPFLERLHKRYGSSDVSFLGVSQDDARSTRNFASEYGVTFPLLLDEDGYPVSNGYGLTNVPTIFLIDSDGKVKVSSMGFDRKDLEAIAGELAERRKIALTPLFRPDEVVPANKPG